MISRVIALITLSAAVCAAHAAPTLTVDSSPRNDGDHSFTYFGRVHNDSPETIYITGDSYDTGNPNVSISDAVLKTDVPIPIPPGRSWSGPLFTLSATGTVVAGSGGLFTVTGSADPTDTDALATDSFLAPFPFDMSDALRALRLAAGLDAPSANDLRRLNDVQTDASAAVIDALDAVSIARKAAGVEQNP